MKRFQEIKYKIKCTFTPYSNENQNSPTIACSNPPKSPAKPTQPVVASVSTFPPQPATMPTFFPPELPPTFTPQSAPTPAFFPPYPPMFNCPPPPTGFIPSQPISTYNSVSPQPPLPNIAFPQPIRPPKRSLPSNMINKSKLETVSTVLAENQRLVKGDRLGQLAVILARRCFFGPDVMAQCTVYGAGQYPALPTKELNELKNTLFKACCTVWGSPQEFEQIWATCATAIGQVCKRQRSLNKIG